jgi:hypothetical protein
VPPEEIIIMRELRALENYKIGSRIAVFLGDSFVFIYCGLAIRSRDASGKKLPVYKKNTCLLYPSYKNLTFFLFLVFFIIAFATFITLHRKTGC